MPLCLSGCLSICLSVCLFSYLSVSSTPDHRRMDLGDHAIFICQQILITRASTANTGSSAGLIFRRVFCSRDHHFWVDRGSLMIPDRDCSTLSLMARSYALSFIPLRWVNVRWRFSCAFILRWIVICCHIKRHTQEIIPEAEGRNNRLKSNDHSLVNKRVVGLESFVQEL